LIQKNKEKAVVIWSEGFPYKLTAANEKNSLIAKALIFADYDVYLTSKVTNNSGRDFEGTIDRIYYRNFSHNQLKTRFIQYIFGVISETRFLLLLKKEYKSIYLIGSYTSIVRYLLYSIFCKIFRINLVLNIMEWHIATNKDLSIPRRVNAFLFDKYAFRLSKGTIAISEFIISNLKRNKSNTKFLLIPALTDVFKIDNIEESQGAKFNYILYCGGIVYNEVIETVINTFKELKNGIHLVLILHGHNLLEEKLRNKIANDVYSDKIHVLSNLNYSSLIQYYKNAAVLLVPLRNSIQDKARYPQKIAEYSACSRPILSNEIGQVGSDFHHKTDIYYANSFTSNDLAEGIKLILQDEKLAEKISNNARKKAERYFDYKNYIKKLDQFLNNL